MQFSLTNNFIGTYTTKSIKLITFGGEKMKNQSYYEKIFKSKFNPPPVLNPTTTLTLPTPGIVGSWLDAIGTVLAAIGSTPSKVLTKTILNDLIFIGNALQGLGSAFVVESPETLANDRVGSAIQSIGNLTVITGLLQEDKRTSILWNRKGNLLQALGGGVSFNYNGQLTSINNIGNGLQVIGNSLQAFSLKERLLDTEEGQLLETTGSWIQAIGTIISAVTYESAERGN